MNSATATIDHQIESNDEWLRASREFLEKEKEFTRLSDDLARRRRELPWTPVEKEYTFDSPRGKMSLEDLFDGRSQLATYHFMLGPDWEEGCPGCSFVTDHINGTVEHLRAQDVMLVLVSRAPLDKIAAFNKRMGWHVPWVSSLNCDFNYDFGVSFTKEDVDTGAQEYNLGTRAPYAEENPGMSFFVKDASGGIFRTYSTYARGLEALLTTYAILDRTAHGRNEGQPKPMAWVRHHDKYEPTVQLAGSCCHK